MTRIPRATRANRTDQRSPVSSTLADLLLSLTPGRLSPLASPRVGVLEGSDKLASSRVHSLLGNLSLRFLMLCIHHKSTTARKRSDSKSDRPDRANSAVPASEYLPGRACYDHYSANSRMTFNTGIGAPLNYPIDPCMAYPAPPTTFKYPSTVPFVSCPELRSFPSTTTQSSFCVDRLKRARCLTRLFFHSTTAIPRIRVSRVPGRYPQATAPHFAILPESRLRLHRAVVLRHR